MVRIALFKNRRGIAAMFGDRKRWYQSSDIVMALITVMALTVTAKNIIMAMITNAKILQSRTAI
jgi:hypothetical protein